MAAYGLDKAAARRDGQRVSEKTLIAIGMLCGWPGALVAQQLFRHKTRKEPFSTRLLLIVAVQAGGLIGLSVAFA